MSERSVTLSFPHQNPNATAGKDELYRVERVTQSVDLSPGQMLERALVRDMCDLGTWNVVVVPPKREK